ncbi:hypothetical protein [Clostridium massiliodielmoense]|nr:hypothetical protein [Clostridium massiliodielmoense]
MYNIDKGQVYREDDGEVVGDIREITAAEALKILMEEGNERKDR